MCALPPFSLGLPFFPLSTSPCDNPTHTIIIYHGIHVPSPVQLPPVLSLPYSGFRISISGHVIYHTLFHILHLLTTFEAGLSHHLVGFPAALLYDLPRINSVGLSESCKHQILTMRSTVNEVHLESGPSGRFQVVITVDIGDILGDTTN